MMVPPPTQVIHRGFVENPATKQDQGLRLRKSAAPSS